MATEGKKEDLEQKKDEPVVEKAVHEMSREELLKVLDIPENVDETETQVQNKGAGQPSPEQTPKTEEPQKPVEKVITPEEKIAMLEARIAKLDSVIENTDKFTARQATELGLLRKITPEEEVKRKQAIRDAFLTDPAEGMRLYNEYEKEIAESKKAEQALQEITITTEVKAEMKKKFPEFEKQIDNMIVLLREDGVPEDRISAFKLNPYLNYTGVLINLYKAAKLRDENKITNESLETLKKENADFKKKSSEFLAGMEKETNRSVMTANSSGTSSRDKEPYLNKPPHLMSREELNKALEKTEE